MRSATVEPYEAPSHANLPNRVVDACRQGASLSHEARFLKSLAVDAVEDGVHATRRAIASLKRRIEELSDFKDEAVHRVKRQPLRAVGIALGSGLVLGLAAGWIGRRPERRA